MTQFTKLIQTKRKAKGDTFESLAKALKISPSFAKHLCYSDIVPVSERVTVGLAKRYGISRKKLTSLADRRNRIGRAYYAEYHRKNPKAA